MVAVRGQRRTLPELSEELFLDIGDSATKRWRFAVLLILAAVIATTGLLADSTATVIGAMIVAPLGVPIIGTALGIVIADGRRLVASVVTVLLGGAAVVVIGWLLAAVLPDIVPITRNSQVSSRTSANLIDLVTAIATGFAGAFGLARKDVSDVMPGVAIAISLVPPLAVVGITLQAGDPNGAFGALELFASNMLAMIVSGSILFTAYGYANEARESPHFKRSLAYGVVAVATILIAIPLTITTVDTVDRLTVVGNAKAIADDWAGTEATVIDVAFKGANLEFVIEDLDVLPPVDLPAVLAEAVPRGTPVVVNRVGGERSELGPVP